MPKVLIADEVAEECARILLKAGIEVDARGKMKPDDLRAAVGGYDGLIVRSAVKVTREILEAGPRLRIVGRAGIGVDNIDTEAATRRGILVMNAPQGNVTSAAEHAFAMILANARNIVRADASMRAGKWERAPYLGVELERKTLGIVGLGKVGSMVAQYAKPFGMRVIAYDPLLVKERAEVLGVELVDLDRLLAESDFITVHTPLSERTRGIIGAEQLRKMKRTARIVNTSRGGVIEEKSLAEALAAREIAGAALDVFEVEPPPKDHPFFRLDNVTLTPHLAASTEEAQVKVSVDIAEQFVDYFKTGVVRNAVNLSAVADPTLAPYMRLAEDLGGLGAQLVEGRVRAVEVVYMGQISAFDPGAITQSAVKGALRPMLGDEINVVNARFAARDAGIQVLEDRRKDARNYKSLVSVRVEGEGGAKTVAGTIFEGREPRIVQLDNLHIDLKPSRYMLYLWYRDVPGVVGVVGTVLGRNRINIARMEVGRTERGKQAMIMLTLDDPAPPPAVEEIRQAVPLDDIRAITLP